MGGTGDNDPRNPKNLWIEPPPFDDLAGEALRQQEIEIADGKPMRGRRARIMDLLMTRTGCDERQAATAWERSGKVGIEQLRAKIPELRERLTLQLAAIAAAHQDENPQAAIAAIREQARIWGLHAPVKVEVNHHEGALQLDAVIGVLDAAGLAALEVIQRQIEQAKTEGRLKLPPSPDAMAGVIDAEFTERKPGAN